MAAPESPRELVFEPFRLDRKDERLWRGKREIRLGHKAFGVLCELAGRPGELVTKDELLAAVWPGTAVSDAVLTTAVRELRRSLGDRARKPRFVETVHGRGYRFVAPVEGRRAPGETRGREAPFPGAVLVGRERERERLREALGAARGGTRRLALVAGEPGIGKSALVDALAAEAAAQGVAVARGQCVEAYGAGEPYLPLLEALARLGREGERPDLARVLGAHAPSWLVHLPSLARSEPAPPGRATGTQMLRELADAFEELTANRPLVLVLEDLHWSDAATLRWIDAITRRRGAARLCVIATYRPVEAIVRGGALRPLVAELRRLPQVAEIALDYLSLDDVRAYTLERCPGLPDADRVASVLHERSHGHPLFLVTIVDELVRAGILAPGTPKPDLTTIAGTVPASIRQHIEQQVSGLGSDERRILEAASVAGSSFPVAAVAAAGGLPEDAVEACCAEWAREGRFVRETGTACWPDGTLTTTYRFRHDLWREVVERTLPAGRKARLHRDIARRLEAAYGERAGDLAAGLALHFEEAREPANAVRYRREAAANAVRRSAYREARDHLERALGLVDDLEAGTGRDREALDLTLELGAVRAASEGWGEPGLDSIYGRARALVRRAPDAGQELRAIWGLLALGLVRAEYANARERSVELLELARREADRSFEMAGRFEIGGIDLLLGHLSPARSELEAALSLYDPGDHEGHLARFGMDLGVFALAWSSHLLWLLGETTLGIARSREAITRSRELDHPLTRAIALAYGTMLVRLAGDEAGTASLAKATDEVCERYGFPYYAAWAEIFRGSVRGPGGVARIRAGIEALEASGGRRSRAYHQALLAEALARAGETDEARRALETGLAALEETGERWCESELYRIEGELLVAGDASAAGAAFRRAIDVAARQGAKALELRAALALASVPGSGNEALARIVRSLPPDFTGADLERARARLARGDR